jgi:hypothetical protein
MGALRAHLRSVQASVVIRQILRAELRPAWVRGVVFALLGARPACAKLIGAIMSWP